MNNYNRYAYGYELTGWARVNLGCAMSCFSYTSFLQGMWSSTVIVTHFPTYENLQKKMFQQCVLAAGAASPLNLGYTITR